MKKNKKLIQILGFKPKENSSNIFIKKYKNHENSNDYFLEVDFKNEKINYGEKINAGRKTTQNFKDNENWVVLECVDRLLEKGYKPEDITLEQKYTVGRGASGGWLDIVVKKDKKTFLMIECKTWGTEFEKEYKNLEKNGGQLFTYFQNDKKADFLVLYASNFDEENNEIEYKNEIVKVEEQDREAGNVNDFYNRWNKITHTNGIFENWVSSYLFENKSLTKKDLKIFTEEESEKLFNRFEAILRKYSVSDSTNAFNKIFNLFLAKIFDEKKRPDDELDFQWRANKDNEVEFQVRLINLYKEGMYAFLEKEVMGISDDDFQYENDIELLQKKKKMLMFNNIFAIKEVFDEETFEDNSKVLREVVQLLEPYQIRYPRKQQHLSNFFERLLTTGLKQKSGQFFTPPPIARFILKSLPVQEKIKKSLSENEIATLPTMIDYAAGSGHFLTETMEEMQNVIDEIDTKDFYPDVIKKVNTWKNDKYDWASKYIYGIEKDYRLVKVAKVGCYFYGDGLAQVVYGDGLDNFMDSKNYRGILKQKKRDQNNPTFDFVISNPPYSVQHFKGDIKNKDPQHSFELFDFLTDNSSEIEVLFIERTKQLLKAGGIAALVLPASIVSSTGIYARAREVILKYFDIIAIAELGKNTFMATATSTVTLFLRRRKNNTWKDIQESIEVFFHDQKDKTVNGVEKIFSKYVHHTFEDQEINFEDYQSLIAGNPNEKIQNSEFFKEYEKKKKNISQILEIEKEKLLYFILAYPQEVVLLNTGEKQLEKNFLGYYFSNRRGSEGIHANNGKSIDGGTSLYDNKDFYNPEKASTYILEAFENKPAREIHEDLKKNISRVDLVDMLTFDRVDFEKTVSTAVKKKIKYNEIWGTEKLIYLEEITDIKKGTSITLATVTEGVYPVIAGGQTPAYFHNKKNREANIITVSASGAYSGFVNYFNSPIFASDCNTIKSKDENKISTYLIFEFLKAIQDKIYCLQRGQAQPHVYGEDLNKIKIPLPPLDIQQKIVDECEKVDSNVKNAEASIEKGKNDIDLLVNKDSSKQKNLKSFLSEINPSKSNAIKDLDKNTAVSFLSMQDVNNNGIITNIQKKELEDVKTGYTFFQENDVLFAKITPCMENGKGALVGKLENNLGFGSTEFFVLRVDNDKLLSKILFYILKSNRFRKEAAENMTGTSGHKRVPQKFIESYQVSLPDFKTQQKIVSEIEKIEAEISVNQKIIDEASEKKEVILKKYL